MRHDAEAIVVGAGPAGATAALVLARAGLEVLLLEKRRFPRDKLCGGFLAARSVNLLEALHGEEAAAGLYHHSDDRFQVWHHGALVADRRLGDRMAFVQRLEFDQFLARQAERAGARLLEEAEAVACETGLEPGAAGAVVRLKDGRELRSRWLVAADGALSRLRRQLEPGFQPGGAALELHVPGGANEPPRLDFGPFPWGYGWRFPKRGCATVGVGGWGAHKGGQRELLKDYLDELGLEGGAAAGWPIPDRPARALAQGRLLLAGDAAGFAEPISGEGIYYALRSGQRAAQAVLAARAAPEGRAAEELRRAYLDGTAHIRRQMRASRLFRPLFYSPRAQRRLLEIFCSLPELRSVEWHDIFIHTARGLLRRQARA